MTWQCRMSARCFVCLKRWPADRHSCQALSNLYESPMTCKTGCRGKSHISRHHNRVVSPLSILDYQPYRRDQRASLARRSVRCKSIGLSHITVAHRFRQPQRFPSSRRILDPPRDGSRSGDHSSILAVRSTATSPEDSRRPMVALRG